MTIDKGPGLQTAWAEPPPHETAIQVAERIASHFDDTLREHFAKQSTISPRHSNRASELGDPCARRLYYNRVNWEESEPIDPELQAIFNEGNIHEPAVIRLLDDLGWRLYREQVSIQDRGLQITGRPEGLISAAGVEILAEVKSASPNTYNHCRDLDDLRFGANWIVRKWYAQLQTYLFLCAKDAGLLIIKNKATGWIRMIAVPLDYEFAETLLKRAETVNAGIRDATPPPYITDTRSCAKCWWFGRHCNPPVDTGPAAAVLTNDEDLEAERIYWSTIEQAGAFEAAEKHLKSRAKATKQDLVLVGDSEMRVSSYDRKAYDVRASTITKVVIERQGDGVRDA